MRTSELVISTAWRRIVVGRTYTSELRRQDVVLPCQALHQLLAFTVQNEIYALALAPLAKSQPLQLLSHLALAEFYRLVPRLKQMIDGLGDFAHKELQL